MTKKDYKGYLIDLDGTMYRGNEPIKEAAPFVERVKEKERPRLFVTNNSTSSPEEVAKKLNKQFNIPALPSEVYTSSLATADYLKTLEGNKVYVIGEAGLREAIEAAGFELVRENPDHVVVGLDREFTYKKAIPAVLAIQNGATFIATNKDTNLPTERGLVPSAGALVAMIETAAHVVPTFIGKPEKIMMDAASEKLGLPKEDILMIGDNYETDILAGINNNLDTLLVLTGFTTEKDLPTLAEQPTYVVNTLNDWEV